MGSESGGGKASDGVENLVCSLGPEKGPGLLIVLCDELADGRFQLGYAYGAFSFEGVFMTRLRFRRIFRRLCHSQFLAAVVLIALVWISGITAASAQNPPPSTTIHSGRTILPGEISIAFAIPSVETKSFTCTPIQPFKKGDKLPARLELDQTGKKTIWSISTKSFQVGTNQVAYPIMVAGLGYTILTAVLKPKTDLQAGQTLHSDGYQIETKRAVRADDSISVLYVIGNMNISLLSMEAASDGKPWFAAFMDDMNQDARASAIEMWRIANHHVAHDSGL